jgi:hypothetical protein
MTELTHGRRRVCLHRRASVVMICRESNPSQAYRVRERSMYRPHEARSAPLSEEAVDDRSKSAADVAGDSADQRAEYLERGTVRNPVSADRRDRGT